MNPRATDSPSPVDPVEVDRLKARIVGYLESVGGHVTFAKLSEHVNGFNGDCDFDVNLVCPNVVLWRDMSPAAIEAILQLQEEGRISVDATHFLTYAYDGLVPALPVARQLSMRGYKELHWLPVTVCLVREHPLPQENAKRTTSIGKGTHGG